MTKQFKVSLLRFRNTVRARVLSRVRLCDPEDCGPPGSSVHEIPQARILKKKKKRILEQVAISSRGSSRPRDGTSVSCLAH